MAKSSAESNRDKFVRLAEARTTRTIKEIRLIGNLSNRNTYSYHQADVEKIFQALEQELKLARSRFEKARQLEPTEFRL
ncbi:MAG: hypothetical protein RBU21_15145 [FCB group bacterium]|nr:hypothetical protein [FCB group bacterium]